MNNQLFKEYPLQKQSIMQKIFRQYPDDNSIIEINNLLACKNVVDIKKTDIDRIKDKYKIDINHFYNRNIEEFYAVYINVFLNDHVLSLEDEESLQHLKMLLNISDEISDDIYNQIAGNIFTDEYKRIIQDGRLDKTKNKSIDKLQNDLKISEDLVSEISERERKFYIKNFLEEILKDDRFSPDEEKELETISKSLKIELEFSKEFQKQLDKFKLFWKIENEDLPEILTDEKLQKNEICYFQINVDFYEEKTSQRAKDYREEINKNILKGSLYNADRHLPGNPISDIKYKFKESGKLLLTNKRLLVVGKERTSIVKYDVIKSFIPFNNGLKIIKEKGKNNLIKVLHNSDTAGVMLAKLLELSGL